MDGVDKVFGEKSIQVDNMGASSELAELKKEKRLMVWGNNIEEEKIYVDKANVSKSEVGIQLSTPTK